MDAPPTPESDAVPEPTSGSVTVRIARLAAGSVVLLTGVTMLVLPGPGLVVVIAGLAILSRDVAWAARTLERVREQHERAKASVRRRTRT